MMNTFKVLLVSCAFATLASVPAHAEDVATTAPSVEVDATVTALAKKMTTTWLTDQQQDSLKLIAHQQAIATHCEAFDVDPARLAEELAAAYPSGEAAEMKDEDLVAFERTFMFAYGILLGSQMTLIAADKAGFCAHAEEERTAQDSGHLIWTAKK
jgi:hypothetical protein